MISKNTSEFIANARDHVAQDKVIGGKYTGPDGQACFIGCHTGGDHPEKLLEMYGLPVMVTRLAEGIFESLTKKEAQQQFHIDLPEAIASDGKDLSMIGWKFLRNTLKRLPSTSSDAVVERVIKLLDRLISGESLEGLKKEFSAAWAAARAAAAAARAAAWAAEDAAAAAWAAARAAAAERDRQRRDLPDLLKEAPIARVEK